MFFCTVYMATELKEWLNQGTVEASTLIELSESLPPLCRLFDRLDYATGLCSLAEKYFNLPWFVLQAKSTTDQRWTCGLWVWSYTRWSAVRCPLTDQRCENFVKEFWGANIESRFTCRPTAKTCSKSFSFSTQREELALRSVGSDYFPESFMYFLKFVRLYELELFLYLCPIRLRKLPG